MGKKIEEWALIQEPPIQVVDVVFCVEDIQAPGTLACVRLDRTLPEHYRVGDLLSADLAPAIAQKLLLLNADSWEEPTRARFVLEVREVRSPASKLVTVKPGFVGPNDECENL